MISAGFLQFLDNKISFVEWNILEPFSRVDKNRIQSLSSVATPLKLSKLYKMKDFINCTFVII